MARDRAGHDYWDSIYAGAELPPALDLDGSSVWHLVWKRMAARFGETFERTGVSGGDLIEIGCARSVWLPVFARTFGFRISGLDYTRSGCEAARRILEREGISGDIHEADLYAPPQELVDRYGVGVSFGLVEHFEDTAACVKACARLLKPGGLLITVIPNMNGVVGALQRWWNRPVYDVHVPLDRPQLAEAHAAAGLEVVECEYLLAANALVINLNGLGNGRTTRAKRSALELLTRVGQVMQVTESKIGFPRPNQFTSPYIWCAARRPQRSADPRI